MKDIFVEQFFVLINPVWDSSPVHTMTEFGQIHYLKISLNNNMYADTLGIISHHAQLSRCFKK